MKRKPLQGVRTVVRFNWHFFVIALVVIGLLLLVAPAFPPFYLAAAGATLALILSLVATAIAYDFSGLYRLDWLDGLMKDAHEVANIHAGFDETSDLIRTRFPSVTLSIVDFYDPEKHTEISIRRARQAHPPAPGTIAFASQRIPFPARSCDLVLLTLAAHEIRDPDERVGFFREIRRILKLDGHVVVTEHLRDLPNLIAYNLGAWHFHTRREWLSTFRESGFQIAEEKRLNPFITSFVLTSYGTST
ncbi:class I SAM-dependent methyltransferase [Haloferula sp.]|uniref:class I SAM-dependent methyltransferase n=1 Tax=Haloferula sp. TaxID=2497595 RepID=UPI003C72E8A0